MTARLLSRRGARAMTVRAMTVRVGPVEYRLETSLPALWRELSALYRDYPRNDPQHCPEYEVSVHPTSWWRRFVRPQINLRADIMGPFAPLPADLGQVAFEMGMNYQVAVGLNRYLILHASSVEREGECVIFSAESGSGKSTLAAGLAWGGWRLLGDEFALIEPRSGLALPFPRPISLKNRSIDVMAERAPADRFSRRYYGAPKGTLGYLLPPSDSIARMNEPARPRCVVFPRFEPGSTPGILRVSKPEAHVLLVGSSTNYQMLGEAGFLAMADLLDACPAYRITYPSLEAAAALVEQIWRHSAEQRQAQQEQAAQKQMERLDG